MEISILDEFIFKLWLLPMLMFYPSWLCLPSLPLIVFLLFGYIVNIFYENILRIF